jgi:hypothetical protein
MFESKWLLYGLLILIGVETTLLVRPLLLDDGRDAVDTKKMGNMEMLILDASRRSIVVSNGGQFCSEPVPDAANTFAKEFAGKLSGERGDAKAAADLSQLVNVEISKLFERSQGIQALRDGMYRLCEAYINHAITEDTYQEHIANLTATLNFIVPIELCSKLNREIVAAISNAATSLQKGSSPDETPTNAPTDKHTTEPQSDKSNEVAGETKPPTPTQNSNGTWLSIMANSELLTSKFTTSCLSIGSDFASRMAATSNILASARYEERLNSRLAKLPPDPTSQK